MFHMKLVHTVKISVFAYPEDDALKISDGICSLVPFSLDDEKLSLQVCVAEGFNDRKIRIFELVLSKSVHVRRFIEHLVSSLSKNQKFFILKTVESRLDSELDFFIRLDKTRLLDSGKFELTDLGNCFHIRMSVAAFPKKRDIALDIVNSIFASH